MAYFIRIFRVLHTVQSSVFKVLCVVFVLTATHLFYHSVSVLSTLFFIYFSLLFDSWYIVSHLHFHVNYFFHCLRVKNNHLEMSGERGI